MEITLYKSRGGLPLKNRARFIRMLREAQEVCGLGGEQGTLQVILLPSQKMAEMNWAHLKHEGATDVLTFDLRDEALPVCDPQDVVAEIYVCPEVAVEYASAHGLDASRELSLYAIHGMIHLTGQDDIADDDRAEMRRKEAAAFAELEKKGVRFDGFIQP